MKRSPVPSGRAEPQYAAIERAIEAAIASGSLQPGAVLLEGPIAAIFGTSRTPVRTALGELRDRGALRRFEGRGFMVKGASEPRRIDVTHAHFDLDGGEPEALRVAAASRISADLEEVLMRALPFGLWRINEKALADHYDVSRTVVRELLPRFQDRGMIRKDRRSHWVLGPLTARGIAQYFEVRTRLEPLALTRSAPHVPPDAADAMRERVRRALEEPGATTPATLAALETDLHVDLLAACDNPHLLRMIGQSQVALVVNRLFASWVGGRSFRVAQGEHLVVLDRVAAKDWEGAGAALERHLERSAERTRQRLKAISVFPEPGDLPDYLVRQRL